MSGLRARAPCDAVRPGSKGDDAMTEKPAAGNLRHSLPYDDLRGWIAEAERLGELRHVTGASWQEEIGMAAEIVSHADDAPAVLFDLVPGCAPGFRVLTNLFAAKRKNMTLGFPVHLGKTELSDAYAEVYSHDSGLIPPVYVEDGPVFENVIEGDAVDLEIFPTPVWHEGDGGRYIGTGSYNVTRAPDGDAGDGWYNLGCYRIMLRDGNTVTFNTAPGKHGRIHHEKYIARGEPMPVVMVLGGDPMTFFLGGSEVPDGVSEFDVVGGLRGKPLELVRGRHTGLPFPADAEIVLEGFVEPDTVVPEGPFGDWTGTYTETGRVRPLTRVVAIYHRNDPIMLGFAPQSLPDEYSRYRAVTRSALLKRNIEAAGVPDVASVWAHEVGGSRMLLAVAIRQRYPGHAKQAGHIACQCHAGAYGGKWVIVVDDDIEVSDLDQLMWATLTRSDPATSIDFLTNAWTSPADPRVEPEQREKGNLTNSRMIIDACIPFHWRDRFPAINRPSEDHARRAREKFSYLLE
jgi:UbiD family decarboxylase